MSLAAVILRADLRSTLNALKRSDRRVVFVIVAGILSVPLLGLAFTLGGALGVDAARPVAPAVLASVFVAGTVMTFILGLSTVITSFFAERDLLLLAVAPVSPASIFLARLLRSMLRNGAMGILLLSTAAGFGVVRQANPIYIVLAPVTIAALVVIVTAFQVALLSAALHVVPASRARDTANVVTALVGTGLYVAWYSLLNGRFGSGLIGQLRAGTGPIGTLDEHLAWLPATWPAQALGDVAQGQVGGGLAWAGATLAFAAVMLGIGYLTYRRACISGIGAFSEGSSQVQRRTVRGAPAARATAGGDVRPASATRAMVRKDWLALRRDARRLARLLPALAMAFAYPIIFFTSSMAGILAALAVPAFSAFFLAQVIGGPAIPSEGRGIQLLHMSPLSSWRLLQAKILFAAPPVVAVCLAAGLSITALRGATPGELALIAVMTVWYASGMTILAVCMGAIDPRFSASDPNRAIGLEGVVIGLIGEAAFSLLTAGAVALVALGLYVSPDLAVLLLSGALFPAAAGFALIVGYLVFAERRLRRWQPG